MSDFLLEIDLIYTSKTISYKELKFKQYRNLLKCFLSDDNIESYASIIKNTTNVIKTCTQLTDSEIDKLTYIDYLLLLFQIRATSVGSDIFLQTEVDDVQIKINLDLNQVIKHIKDSFTFSLYTKDQFGEYYFRLPTINELLKIEKNDINSSIFFIEKIISNNTTILFDCFTDLEKEKILQSLPLKSLASINKQIKKIISHIKKSNFLYPIYNETFQQKVPLYPLIKDNIFLIKLVYNNSLLQVYDTMFILSKFANMSGDFLDNCSPGEFFYFSKKFEELTVQQQQAQAAKKQSVFNNSNLPPVNATSPETFF